MVQSVMKYFFGEVAGATVVSATSGVLQTQEGAKAPKTGPVRCADREIRLDCRKMHFTQLTSNDFMHTVRLVISRPQFLFTGQNNSQTEAGCTRFKQWFLSA